jgi:hypothetical protein
VDCSQRCITCSSNSSSKSTKPQQTTLAHGSARCSTLHADRLAKLVQLESYEPT